MMKALPKIARRYLAIFAVGAACASLVVGSLVASCVSSGASSSAYKLAPVPRVAASPREGVYYEVFVRSFADSNGDGVGDFKGLTARLDYLNDGDDSTTGDLGVTGIWLMPIFPSHSYHGYDVDDYYSVNPQYGTMEDFQEFLAAAKKRGIAVIIDMTCNHSSNANPWFVASQDPSSPYRSWYRWISGGDKRYSVNQKTWGHNLWNKVGDSYYAGLFDRTMPDYDLSTSAVRDEMKKIMKFWLDRGVDGFRYDAALHIFNSAKIAPGENGQDEAVEFWKDLVGYVRSVKPDAYTVGEVWDSALTRATYMKGLYSTFHFDLGTKIVEAIRSGEAGDNNIANALYAEYQTYSAANPDYVDAPFLSNHDQNRVSGMLKGDPARLKLAASIYMLAEGVPFIYYGEEIGLMGAKPDEQLRTPMLWDESGKASWQTRWIESKYNKNTIPVSAQERDTDSLLNYYKRLVRIKTSNPSLFAGRLSPLGTGDSSVLSWLMTAPQGKAFVVHNLSSKPVKVKLPAEVASFALSFATYKDTAVSRGFLTISPLGSAVLSPAQ